MRLSRGAAAVTPPRPPAREYDLSRLTPDQLHRMAVLRGRIDAVGLPELIDGEVDELAAMSELLLTPEPPGSGTP